MNDATEVRQEWAATDKIPKLCAFGNTRSPMNSGNNTETTPRMPSLTTSHHGSSESDDSGVGGFLFRLQPDNQITADGFGVFSQRGDGW